ncbi:Isoprenylcysteine carboxyl methyltransferase family-domain-containing protein [Suillus clintonianus]|uniref:Isoprenylcysteine carboxyl methyltransferase family-domain-containing protein n=1 Tax=Suillus clintonianus TaxID=1904413 RepID=UPI001B865DB1|nr:Isoprenylcysteine carboxyl methyltransferase family-domain-containing protein [Suillus clintonianus]KAG2112102.1 Isoprenylcysteine carboxyl methyltransferase family-domain-containing protein [Suillus clintonianus]
MSLLKVPLILSSAIAVHISLTPPNHPLNNEVVHQTLIEWIIIQDVKYGLPLAKIVSWAVSLAEIAVLASRVIDPSTLPSVMQLVVGPLRGIQDMPINYHILMGTALIVAGGFLRWWCFRTLGRFFTFKLSVRKEHKLVTSGPYAVVRHPSYAGTILRSIGMLMLYASQSSFLRRSGVLNSIPGLTIMLVALLVERIVAVTSLVCRIGHEDEVMKSISRDEWEDWAKVVRYRLIPGIY